MALPNISLAQFNKIATGDYNAGRGFTHASQAAVSRGDAAADTPEKKSS